MSIVKVTNFEDLHSYKDQWDVWADGVPFRCWNWATTWWKHYGVQHGIGQSNSRRKQLAVFLVFAEADSTSIQSSFSTNQLIGILPAYEQFSSTLGTEIRLLGDGEVCSEYLDLLCEDRHLQRVSLELADHLIEHSRDWNLLALESVCPARSKLQQLCSDLELRGCHWIERSAENCWGIELPESWDAFLAMQSKSHRKQLRRLESRISEPGASVWNLVERLQDFDTAWDVLIDLHQIRRQSLGEPGCFASPRWANFHREIAQILLAEGKLRLSTLSLQGRPVAAEYHIADGDSIFVYQGGFDPKQRTEEPGKLSMIRCIQHAIGEGRKTFDLLRGDEPYKPHWRAVPQPMFDRQIISPRMWAYCRHQSWTGIRKVGRAVKRLAQLFGSHGTGGLR